MQNITFANNSALIYGDDIASVPKYLLNVSPEQLNSTSFHNQSEPIKTGNNSGVMIDVQSGGNISLYFTVIDKYGTVVATDN